MSYILAIDQGTTSSRAVVFDKNGKAVSQASRRHQQIYEKPGWVSHNAEEIFFNVVESAKQAISQSGATISNAGNSIAAIGITNQRETIVAWDKRTGEPACNAIVWQCKRTADMCQTIKNDGCEEILRQKTGLFADPYFSASKMRWILENVPRAKVLMESGFLAFGTIDSYIIFRLTKGKSHITDYTNASRTLLFNINNLKWDTELLNYFNIPVETLPAVVPSMGVSAYADKEYFGEKIPIAGIAGDQHAALFGQNCFNQGDVKNTYGTGCFILQNVGVNAPSPQKGLLNTIAWHLDKTTYAVEASIFSAGSAIEWLISSAKLISGVTELEHILSVTPNTGGVYFVPALSGLGAPVWDMDARAAFFGMSLATTKEHLVRAVCESIVFSVKDALDYISARTGIPIKKLNVDGGVSKNDIIMQLQADILNIPVYRPENIETTVLGAAKLAGLAVGVYKNLSLTESGGKVFYPKTDRAASYESWKRAVERSVN